MTLAKNYNGFAERVILTTLEEIKVGAIITGMVHWSKSGGNFSPDSDLDGRFQHGDSYVFECENFQGHEVNYELIEKDEGYAEKMREYGINEDCFGEKEVIADKEAKFEIIDIDEFDAEDTGLGWVTCRMI